MGDTLTSHNCLIKKEKEKKNLKWQFGDFPTEQVAIYEALLTYSPLSKTHFIPRWNVLRHFDFPFIFSLLSSTTTFRRPFSMGSRPRRSIASMPVWMRRNRRRLQSRRNRVCKPVKKSTRIISNNSAAATLISDKLEALKSLIPAHIDGEDIKADELFQETADYIVLLRTQILVLQKLITFYACPPPPQDNNQNAV